MKFSKKEIIIIKGDLEPTYFTGNNISTNMITDSKGYTLKKICHSNTHIIIEDSISLVSNLYEAKENEITYEDMDFIFTENLSECKYVDLAQLPKIYGKLQIEEIIKKFRLVNVEDKYIRLEYKLIKRILSIMLSLENTNQDKREFLSFYPSYILDWVNENFTDLELSINVYLILELYYEDRIYEYENILKEYSIAKRSKEEIIKEIQNIFVKESEDIIKKIE